MNHVDRLEFRSLYSVSFANGVLVVSGTGDSDVITVSLQRSGQYVGATLNGQTSLFKRVSSIVVNGGDGNDSIAIDVAVPSNVHGGNGNDTINGSDAADRLYGDAGNDAIYAGAGDDLLDGGTGSDLLSGGAGFDVVSYADRTANVTVSIKRGNYDDGERGEKDNVRVDVEGVLGGAGDDSILGYEFNDKLYGGDGNDTITGDEGNDTINGDAGDDELYGTDGGDRLSGGDGDDYLEGGGGRNALYGNAGDDELNAHNDNTDDAVDGGTGRDYAKIDEAISDSGYDRDNRQSIERTRYYVIDNRDDDGFF